MLSRAAVNIVVDMVPSCRTPLLRLTLLLSLCSCWCRFHSGVRCTHLLSPVLEARSVLLERAESRRLSRSRRMQSGILYYLHFSFSRFTTWMKTVVEYLLLNSACSCGCFRRVSSVAFFVSTFVSNLYLIVDISV